MKLIIFEIYLTYLQHTFCHILIHNRDKGSIFNATKLVVVSWVRLTLCHLTFVYYWQRLDLGKYLQ